MRKPFLVVVLLNAMCGVHLYAMKVEIWSTNNFIGESFSWQKEVPVNTENIEEYCHDEKTLEMLVDLGVELDNWARSSLHRAARDGDINAVKKLVPLYLEDSIIDLFDRCRQTPLYRGTKSGNKDVLEALLDAGADPNKMDYKGRSPLFQLVRNNDGTAVRFFLQKCHDKGIALSTATVPGQDPLLITATLKNNTQIVKELCQPQYYPDFSVKDDYGRSLFFIAVQRENLELAELFANLQPNFDINEPCVGGFTPFCAAVYGGNGDVVAWLLKRFSGINVNQPAVSNKTPLYKAVENEDFAMVKFLLEHAKDIDVNKATDSGWTPLHRAAYQDAGKIVALLLFYGAKHDSKTDAGCVPKNFTWNSLIGDLLDNHSALKTAVQSEASWGPIIKKHGYAFAALVFMERHKAPLILSSGFLSLALGSYTYHNGF